ncbi:MAG TPA: hypothetical protein PKC18_03935 [Lacipirellulaceae bacterium]|nr:hypothetical protein [Lacipirellulaceae bacterium]HMP04734.1 hypothetical protein [Lacipirellulaceae bacterium]
MATAAKSQSGANGTQARGAGEKGKTRPVWTKRNFPLTVAVFEFPNDSGVRNFSVKLTRTFRRDEASDWESSDYLGASDLLRGAKLLEAADAYVQARLEADYQARKAEASEADGNGRF